MSTLDSLYYPTFINIRSSNKNLTTYHFINKLADDESQI